MEEKTITLCVECPHCGCKSMRAEEYPMRVILSKHENVTFGQNIIAFKGGLQTDSHQRSGEQIDSGCSAGTDCLYSGICDNCGAAFSIDLACDACNPYLLRELRTHVYCSIRLHPSGFPKEVIVNGQEFEVKRLKSWQPLTSFATDILLSRPPFGTYIVMLSLKQDPLIRMRCVICVRPGGRFLAGQILHELSEIHCLIEKADMWGHELLTGITKTTHEEVREIPSELLVSAAFTVICRTEAAIRKTVWNHLKRKYDKGSLKWWTGVLGKEVCERLRDRAKRSGNKDFAKYSPADYITLGEIREVIDSRWKSDFFSIFSSKARLIDKLRSFELLRNDVAHARPIQPNIYKEIEKISQDLQEIICGRIAADPPEFDEWWH